MSEERVCGFVGLLGLLGLLSLLGLLGSLSVSGSVGNQALPSSQKTEFSIQKAMSIEMIQLHLPSY